MTGLALLLKKRFTFLSIYKRKGEKQQGPEQYVSLCMRL
jgi:hypothetical protein